MTDEHFPSPRKARFGTTRWSLVVAAGQQGDARSAEALASLCEMYWYPVYAFVRRQGHQSDESADLTQEFFARVLEKNYFQDADPTRGRFRSFLCSSVRHFLSNERDRSKTVKRGGRQTIVPLEIDDAERRYQLEPRDDRTPEKLFDRRWALILLERVLNQVQKDQAASGKSAQFDRLKGFLTGDSADTPYSQVAAASGMTEGAVKVAIHRLRRQFRDALVEEIAETVSDPSEVTAEIEYLLKAMSA